MAIGILGRKVGMTQIFDESGQRGPGDGDRGRALPRAAGPHRGARRLRSGAARLSATSPAGWPVAVERGHVAKLDSKRSKKPRRRPASSCSPRPTASRSDSSASSAVRPARLDGRPEARRSTCSPSVKAVDVTGITKGRGTAGVMKRHNFKGQRATHGVKKVHRHCGGTGRPSTFPGRVVKGKRMAGQYGNEQSTMRNLKVVRVDAENNLLLVRGAVPGPNGGYVVIQANEQAVASRRAERPDRASGCRAREQRTMASLTVYDRTGKEVGTYDIEPDRSRAAHQQAVAARRGRDVPGEPAAGHAQDQEPRRGRRLDQEDVSPKGHGQRPGRLAAQRHPPRRRSHLRQAAARLDAIACRARRCSWPRGWRWPRRFATTQVVVIDELAFAAPKTKDMAAHPQGAEAATAARCWWPRPSTTRTCTRAPATSTG